MTFISIECYAARAAALPASSENVRAAPILMRNCFGRGGGLWPAGAGRRVPYPLVPVILACRRGSGGSDRLAGAGRWPLPRPVGEGGTPMPGRFGPVGGLWADAV